MNSTIKLLSVLKFSIPSRAKNSDPSISITIKSISTSSTNTVQPRLGDGYRFGIIIIIFFSFYWALVFPPELSVFITKFMNPFVSPTATLNACMLLTEFKDVSRKQRKSTRVRLTHYNFTCFSCRWYC